jgi:hypothetical protein
MRILYRPKLNSMVGESNPCTIRRIGYCNCGWGYCMNQNWIQWYERVVPVPLDGLVFMFSIRDHFSMLFSPYQEVPYLHQTAPIIWATLTLKPMSWWTPNSLVHDRWYWIYSWQPFLFCQCGLYPALKVTWSKHDYWRWPHLNMIIENPIIACSFSWNCLPNMNYFCCRYDHGLTWVSCIFHTPVFCSLKLN